MRPTPRSRRRRLLPKNELIAIPHDLLYYSSMPKDTEPHNDTAGEATSEEIERVVREYSSQADYVAKVTAAAESRSKEVAKALRAAFAGRIRQEELEVIDFQATSALELGQAIAEHPIILKPLLAVCNVAGRAIERDLDLRNVDTYGLRLSRDQAHAIAGYIKPFLPPSLPLPALSHMDRVLFIDKEVRASKGQWEKLITEALIRFSGLPFKKTKFKVRRQEFELDSAFIKGKTIAYAVDVKRIEARRDIHKRIDEIANKANKFKLVYPKAKFGAVIYYPFPAEHGNIRDRLETRYIDSIQFAGESQQSIYQAVRLLLAKFGLSVNKDETT